MVLAVDRLILRILKNWTFVLNLVLENDLVLLFLDLVTRNYLFGVANREVDLLLNELLLAGYDLTSIYPIVNAV